MLLPPRFVWGIHHSLAVLRSCCVATLSAQYSAPTRRGTSAWDIRAGGSLGLPKSFRVRPRKACSTCEGGPLAAARLSLPCAVEVGRGGHGLSARQSIESLEFSAQRGELLASARRVEVFPNA